MLSACSDGGRDAGQPAAAPKPETAHWGYEGHEGPEHWADLSDDFAACRSGKQQSPIDITNPAMTGHADLDGAKSVTTS